MRFLSEWPESATILLFGVAGRAMAPVIEKMSRQYPKIPVYKVDIDMVSEQISLLL